MTPSAAAHIPTDCVKLLQQACPTPADVPFFNHCMRLARNMGMTWEDGLRYVIEQRSVL